MKYAPRRDYTTAELVRELIRDLIADARRGDEASLAQLKTILPQRHRALLDQYGWPVCLK